VSSVHFRYDSWDVARLCCYRRPLAGSELTMNAGPVEREMKVEGRAKGEGRGLEMGNHRVAESLRWSASLDIWSLFGDTSQTVSAEQCNTMRTEGGKPKSVS